MVRVASLGTALLDEFEWLPPAGDVAASPSSAAAQRQNEVRVGGGGVYAAVGARMWLPPSEVGLLVHRGLDFPAAIQRQLDSFGSALWHYVDVALPTPRALNTYHLPSSARRFRLLTPPPPHTVTSLASASPDLARADYLHICCSPEHLWLNVLPELELDLAADESHPAGAAASPSVTAANVASGSSNATPRKRMIYEPLPPSCTPSSLPLLCRILPHIHLFSPNHEEAASLLGLGECAQVEMMAQEFSEMGARRVVIRAGEKGSYVLERERRGAERQVEGNWVAPYHQKPEKVVDTVGAGNSFLGGLAASLVKEPSDLLLAVQRGSVAASFVIEQVGLPTLSSSQDKSGRVMERWNGEEPEVRLAELQRR